MFDKLFGWGKKKPEERADPGVVFGRYSDNNKLPAKVNRWTDADNHFKEKQYPESLDAFFDYLTDERAGNVVYERNGAEGRFSIFQGSKIVRGSFGPAGLSAEVTLARMPQPSVPVMRRLLELNFNLYYSRYAMEVDRLCMRFDTETVTASPSKLYYGLKELATRADKQDDLLVQDFTHLISSDTEHIIPLPEAEKATKYRFLQQWISETLDTITSMDADKFSGAHAYLLLSLIYRIDYLLAPEGQLLHHLEKIHGIYFKKDERPVTEKNRDMAEEFRKISAMPAEEVYRNLFRSKYTFAIVAPQAYKTIAESIHAANQNMVWYRDNSYPQVASRITEYGIAYCQYSYSLPKAVTDLFHLFMEVNYAAYFLALGYSHPYYDPASGRFDEEGISNRIYAIQQAWKEKYPLMDFKTQNLRFDSLVNFNLTFTNEMEFLNMEPK